MNLIYRPILVYYKLSYRYIILRNILAKAWQKGYLTNISNLYLLKDIGSGPTITPF